MLFLNCSEKLLFKYFSISEERHNILSIIMMKKSDCVHDISRYIAIIVINYKASVCSFKSSRPCHLLPFHSFIMSPALVSPFCVAFSFFLLPSSFQDAELLFWGFEIQNQNNRNFCQSLLRYYNKYIYSYRFIHTTHVVY